MLSIDCLRLYLGPVGGEAALGTRAELDLASGARIIFTPLGSQTLTRPANKY